MKWLQYRGWNVCLVMFVDERTERLFVAFTMIGLHGEVEASYRSFWDAFEKLKDIMERIDIEAKEVATVVKCEKCSQRFFSDDTIDDMCWPCYQKCGGVPF